MNSVDRYKKLRDEFVELIVEHYKTLNDKEKSEEIIQDIRENITNDIDSIIEEVGLEEAIHYVEDLLDNQEEFFTMSEQVYAGVFDFKEMIDPDIDNVMGININDILLREDEVLTCLCKVIGFTQTQAPIVEFLNVEYNPDIDLNNGLLYYKIGDIMPYPHNDFHKDKFI